ncbi:D-tagatose-bisphosphate aldolase, class II, non-catalytic subunit [Psychrobium sp. 1_MG-2023]|uniref:D-tagatose-bisphosphate aldolase, class II, non-catalytic subunit n=1 Tax=Psychrobium sp. 1_MG-2023 TaxID=3062624 RepID=UPI0027351CBE|nr:D-tagatose-bisphosphate aldolase, class II, non-catalytic subunit [Psychrobium sp. 1_MG-2023]MDP2560752.1 D-tagatose-bisphosphate aldolase, class II, non-catalytic subunit [Psychrobium sp. 1_MG-2023]
MNHFQQLMQHNRQGKPTGIYAICSAHPLVIEAALEQAKADSTPILIEATANQVNQFGGYTGMTPQDFYQYVVNIAKSVEFPTQDIFLGGDHLGPVCWKNESARSAMEKSAELIKHYIAAGFKKIHLDCSMPCADDTVPLANETIAQRAAELCAVAEHTAQEVFGQSDIVYIIGTEVPPPGGADHQIESIEVTSPDDAKQTLLEHQHAFHARRLYSAWSRVIGLVVQPGVEFDHTSIIDYQPHKAQALKAIIPQVDNIVFEAHSTDYQTPESYQQLIQDHFAILKVGPQLTFALREALFALSNIETYLIEAPFQSNLKAVCEKQMLEQPGHWQPFYQVDSTLQPLYRQFSYSDRIRYYWPNKQINQATERLFTNLENVTIPLPLISQFMPEQYQAIRSGVITNSPRALVKAKIKQVTQSYAQACWKQSA